MSTIKKSYLYVSQMVVNSLLPLITIPIITSRLEPSEYGVYALALVYATFLVGIAMLGLTTGYERNFFIYRDKIEKTNLLLSTVTLFSLSLLLLVGLLLFSLNEYLAVLLFNNEAYGEILIILFSALAFQSAYYYYLSFLKNNGFALSFSVITISQNLIYFALVIYFMIFLDLGLVGLALAYLCSTSLVFFTVMYMQFKGGVFRLDKNMLVEALKISLPLTPRIFFGMLSTQFDKIMLGMMSSMGGVGFYSIGQKISYVVFQFMTALDHVFIPEINHRLFSANRKELIKGIGVFLIPYYFFSMFAALCVILFSEELFLLLLPSSYHGGIEISIILTIFYCSMFMGKVSGTQLIYSKKTYITSILALVGILINVLINIPFILLWGSIGAAIATTLSGIIMVGISYNVAQRYVAIIFEWKTMLIVSSILILGVIWVISLRVFFIDEYVVRFIGKIVILMMFIYVGKIYKIITADSIRELFLLKNK